MPDGQTMGSRFIELAQESGSENLRRWYSAVNGLKNGFSGVDSTRAGWGREGDGGRGAGKLTIDVASGGNDRQGISA